MSRLLVYEQRPLNAAVFARLADVELQEVRSLTQLESAIDPQASAAQIIAVEVTQENFVRVVRCVRQAKLTTSAAVIAMPDATLDVGVGTLCEAGADLVFRSMLECPQVATLIRNKIEQQRTSCDGLGDGEQLTAAEFRRRTWSLMPWKRHATSQLVT